MKNFVLDSTYKDITIINSNDDISIVPSHNLSYSINNNALNLNKVTTNCISNDNKNYNFSKFSIIDYL